MVLFGIDVVVKGVHNAAEIFLVLLGKDAEQGIQTLLHAVVKHLESGFSLLGKADAEGTPVSRVLFAVKQTLLHHAVHQQGRGGDAHAEVVGQRLQRNALMAVGHQPVEGAKSVHLADGERHDFLVVVLVHFIQVIPFKLVENGFKLVDGGGNIYGRLDHADVMSNGVNSCQTKINNAGKLLSF